MCENGEKNYIVIHCVCMAVGCLCLRMYVVCSSGTELVSSGSHYSSFTLYNIRGQITDCSGQKITSSDYENCIIAKPSLSSLDTLRELLDSRTYSALKQRMEKGSPVTANIGKKLLTPTAILFVYLYIRGMHLRNPLFILSDILTSKITA